MGTVPILVIAMLLLKVYRHRYRSVEMDLVIAIAMPQSLYGNRP